MESRAKILGHSAHQILIVFPLGLLATAVLFDGVHLATGTPAMATVAYWMTLAGILGAFAASPFGWIDWFAIPRGTRAKRVGLAHGLTNVAVTLVFIAGLYLRWDAPESPPRAAQYLGFAGAALALVGGWLGGELVGRLGVGVDDGAHLDAPNSLSREPAGRSGR